MPDKRSERPKSDKSPVSQEAAESDSAERISQAKKPEVGFVAQKPPSEGWHADEKEHHRIERRYWKITAVLTVVAVVGTLATVALSLSGLREAQRSAREAHRQADVAEQALHETTAAFKTDERAWVVIKSFTPKRLPPSPGFEDFFSYEIRVANVGKTAARNVIIYAANLGSSTHLGGDVGAQSDYLKDTDSSKDAGERQKGDASFIKSAQSTIAPGSSTIAPIISAGISPRMYGGVNVVYSYILGRIEYMDNFGIHHWSKFCFFVGNSDGDLRHCQAGNEEDTNQEPQ